MPQTIPTIFFKNTNTEMSLWVKRTEPNIPQFSTIILASPMEIYPAFECSRSHHCLFPKGEKLIESGFGREVDMRNSYDL